MAQVVRGRLHEFPRFQVKEWRTGHGTPPSQEGLLLPALAKFIHYRLPGTFHNGGVQGRKIGATQRKIQIDLTRGVIFGGQKALGSKQITGAEAFPGEILTVNSVVSASAADQTIAILHNSKAA